MLKQLGLVLLMLFGLAVNAEAQQRIFVRQNGCVVMVIPVPKIVPPCRVRVEPPRCEQPRHERRGRARVLIPMPSTGHYDPVLHIFRPSCKWN